MDTKKLCFNPNWLLLAAIGHLVCWSGDLLLYFIPNGPLDTARVFNYADAVSMLQGTNSFQFTMSGILGVVAMMMVIGGYYQLYLMQKAKAKISAIITLVGTLLTCIAGAVMHYSATSMFWYFVESGLSEQAYSVMFAYFMETMPISVMCNLGVLLVCVSLFISVIREKTALPRWACIINTIPLTMLASIPFSGMGAMNVGSSLMFLGLYFLTRKINK